MGPYLMENSQEKERTYLFSISSGMQMTAVSIGQWIGGYLPAWFAAKFAISAMVTQAYSMSLWAVAFGGLLAVVPMLLVTKSLTENATVLLCTANIHSEESGYVRKTDYANFVT